MNKQGQSITLSLSDIEELFDIYVGGDNIVDDLEVEIFTDEFGTHAQLKESPEDGCVTLELK